jgi:(S)-2-hydroxyglutarate dehydrogenase
MDDLVVVGGGIVGLATARAVLERRPDARITLLEKADEVGTGQTGHNSGVIHAGIYYAPGSLKARLSREGRIATVEFCERHGIPFELVGKLVVATDERERERLDALEGRARANGIELERIGEGELREREPEVRGVSAIWSPTTGIVDYRAVARALRAELEEAGVTVRLGTRVTGIAEDPRGVIVRTDDGGELRAARLVACAGLQADRIARLGGLRTDVRIVPFRGEYFELAPERSGIVRHLIYPVPDPSMPFLGVHLSPTIDGRMTVGPNAVLGLAREGYPRGSVSPRDVADFALYPGFWRMAARNARPAAIELRNSALKRGYLAECRKYAPSLALDDLRTRSAGIRAQAVRRDGALVEDFLIERTARQVHVLNAPSPAATSAIPIGRELADRLLGDAD